MKLTFNFSNHKDEMLFPAQAKGYELNTSIAARNNHKPLKTYAWRCLYQNKRLEELELYLSYPEPELLRMAFYAVSHGVNVRVVDVYAGNSVYCPKVFNLPQAPTWEHQLAEERKDFKRAALYAAQVKQVRKYEEQVEPLVYESFKDTLDVLVREHNDMRAAEAEKRDALDKRQLFASLNFEFDEVRVVKAQEQIIQTLERMYDTALETVAVLVHPGGMLHTGAFAPSSEVREADMLRTWLDTTPVITFREKGNVMERLTEGYARFYDLPQDEPEASGKILLAYLDAEILPDFSWLPSSAPEVEELVEFIEEPEDTDALLAQATEDALLFCMGASIVPDLYCVEED